ncbi:hypothetical protein AAFF_G00258580 [Aldrovandia affinis]|uniref:Uncharacterized protein n=1 Tax=Aldrovandia affinis TaxID=143900 RepID=A0AAD7ST93_9TELE|nr:hypothetical protein AAFF_G00258580 [Aldrovandia affinis]
MADPSEANRLTSASARGDLTEVKDIIQNGADVNERNMFGRTPIQVMKLGNPALAQVLLQANADPNVLDPLGGLTVLHDTARDGYADTLRVLVDYGADVNIQDRLVAQFFQDHKGWEVPTQEASLEEAADVVTHYITFSLESQGRLARP